MPSLGSVATFTKVDAVSRSNRRDAAVNRRSKARRSAKALTADRAAKVLERIVSNG